MWKGGTKIIMKNGSDRLGSTKGKARIYRIESWWWNGTVQSAIERKKAAGSELGLNRTIHKNKYKKIGKRFGSVLYL